MSDIRLSVRPHFHFRTLTQKRFIQSNLSETNFSLSKRRLKLRWIRPPLLPLSLVLVNSPRTWTQPLRELNLSLGQMRLDLYGPPLPPHLGDKQSIQDSDPRHHLGDQQSMHESDPRHVSDEHSGQSKELSRVVSARPKKTCR